MSQFWTVMSLESRASVPWTSTAPEFKDLCVNNYWWLKHEQRVPFERVEFDNTFQNLNLLSAFSLMIDLIKSIERSIGEFKNILHWMIFI